ncbi:hypothetical protein VNO77_22775 [Canavalia gladiata]|uniref:Uncharacterized protein n=1 Tax=Canavalia gladiata TaxID=3824 RepID=A0AAN9L4N8_CANGL
MVLIKVVKNKLYPKFKNVEFELQIGKVEAIKKQDVKVLTRVVYVAMTSCLGIDGIEGSQFKMWTFIDDYQVDIECGPLSSKIIVWEKQMMLCALVYNLEGFNGCEIESLFWVSIIDFDNSFVFVVSLL